MDLRKRLDLATFADEEPVGIAGVQVSELPGPLANERWSYVPEPLWQRLLLLGGAYSLHFSQVSEPIIDTVLDPQQCQSLCDELTFLQETVADPAVHSAIATILAQASVVARSPSMRLVISPP